MKERLDVILVEQGYAPSREKAKAIIMSEPSAVCTSIEVSGERKRGEPSICDWKATPSSLILRRAARENTWNPPLSVKMGLSQCIKLCSPPALRINSWPGRRKRW